MAQISKNWVPNHNLEDDQGRDLACIFGDLGQGEKTF
jgi:hypothetical protein